MVARTTTRVDEPGTRVPFPCISDSTMLNNDHTVYSLPHVDRNLAGLPTPYPSQ